MNSAHSPSSDLKSGFAVLVTDATAASIIGLAWFFAIDSGLAQGGSFLPSPSAYFRAWLVCFGLWELWAFFSPRFLKAINREPHWALRLLLFGAFGLAVGWFVAGLGRVAGMGVRMPSAAELGLFQLSLTFYYALLRPRLVRQGHRLFEFSAAIALLAGSLLFAELAFRGVVRLWPEIVGAQTRPALRNPLALRGQIFAASTRRHPFYLEKKLGWRVSENYSMRFEARDAAGQKYPVNYRTNEYGFRLFGMLETHRTKILILGDSFTHAMSISGGKTYGAHIGRWVGAEVFVYGGGGFGSLQEYLILDEYIDLIRPDLILWQFCANDFVNNCYELELLSWANSNGTRRPYLKEDGTLFYAIPRKAQRLHEFANAYSELLYFVLTRLGRLSATRADSVETIIIRQKGRHAGFQKSIRITEQIMRKARQRAGDVPLLVFSVDKTEPMYSALVQLVEDSHAQLLEGVPERIEEAEKAGQVTRVADGSHWSELGHELCAQTIVEYLQKHPVFENSTSPQDQQHSDALIPRVQE